MWSCISQISLHIYLNYHNVKQLNFVSNFDFNNGGLFSKIVAIFSSLLIIIFIFEFFPQFSLFLLQQFSFFFFLIICKQIRITHHFSTNILDSPVRALMIQVIPRRKLWVWCHLWLCQIVIFCGWNRYRIGVRWYLLTAVHIGADLLFFHVHQNAWRMTSERWSFLD